MNTQELRKLGLDSLANELKVAEEHFFRLKMQLAQGTLTKNHLVRVARKKIATIKTLMTEQKKG
jgi:large subunit ribosomal protein L29